MQRVELYGNIAYVRQLCLVDKIEIQARDRRTVCDGLRVVAASLHAASPHQILHWRDMHSLVSTPAVQGFCSFSSGGACIQSSHLITALQEASIPDLV